MNQRSTAQRQHALTSVFSTDLHGLYTGKIIDIHPSNTTVDVKLFNGNTLRGVRVLFNSANTVAGYRYLASIQNVNPRQTLNGVDDTPELSHIADSIAIVAFLDGNGQTPRVIGFDFPLDSQLHLDEDGLSVNRHESGIYEIITKDGHHETHYPDGSYVIYGTDTTPKDMTAIKGSGQEWETPAGASINLTVHLSQGVTIQAVNGVLSINGGTESVARVGDSVDLTTGKITSGSATFKA